MLSDLDDEAGKGHPFTIAAANDKLEILEVGDARLNGLKIEFADRLATLRESVEVAEVGLVHNSDPALPYFEKLYSCLNTMDRIVLDHPKLAKGPPTGSAYFKSMDG